MFCLSFISFSGKNSKKNMKIVSEIIAVNLNKKAKEIPVTMATFFQNSKNTNFKNDQTNCIFINCGLSISKEENNRLSNVFFSKKLTKNC